MFFFFFFLEDKSEMKTRSVFGICKALSFAIVLTRYNLKGNLKIGKSPKRTEYTNERYNATEYGKGGTATR